MKGKKPFTWVFYTLNTAASFLAFVFYSLTKQRLSHFLFVISTHLMVYQKTMFAQSLLIKTDFSGWGPLMV